MKIISNAPSRISLFGGGTDIGTYSDIYGGICLNMAINIRQHITLDSESITKDLRKYDDPIFSENILNEFQIDKIGLVHTYDNTIESGLGSSAAYAVALIGAINRLKGLNKKIGEIAEAAWDIEVNRLGLYGGKQDQYAAAYGGMSAMEFTRENVNVVPLAKGFIEPILPYFLLFYTGFNRKSANIQEEFKVLTADQIYALNQIKGLAVEGIEAMGKADIEKIAHTLNKTWEFKKLSNPKVTNKNLDEIYDAALGVGALAGKVLGAGGGGHMLFMVDPVKAPAFISKMRGYGLKYIDFSICWQGLDVRIT